MPYLIETEYIPSHRPVDTAPVRNLVGQPPEIAASYFKGHSTTLDLDQLSRDLHLPTLFLSDLVAVCPKDLSPHIIGGQARIAYEPEFKKQTGYSDYRIVDILHPNRNGDSDLDLVIPPASFSEALAVAQRHLIKVSIRSSRACPTLQLIEGYTSDGFPVQIHAFQDSAGIYPGLYHALHAADWPDTLSITLLPDQARLQDPFKVYRIDQDHPQIPPFPEFFKAKDARTFNTAVSAAVRRGNKLTLWHHRHPLNISLDEISPILTPPIAAAICAAFSHEIKNPPNLETADNHTYEVLEQLGILPLLRQAIDLAQDPEAQRCLDFLKRRATAT